jgi:hypothetical protein
MLMIVIHEQQEQPVVEGLAAAVMLLRIVGMTPMMC